MIPSGQQTAQALRAGMGGRADMEVTGAVDRKSGASSFIQRVLRVAAAIGLSVSVMACWFHESVLLAIGNFLIIQDELKPADVIHVVSGPDYRADYGIRLMKQGYGNRIFFTGGWCSVIQAVHAERAKNRAISQGLPSPAIFTDDSQVISTYEEALRLKSFIENSPGITNSIIVVSDPYHMRRSRWAYQRVLGQKIELKMTPIPFELLPYEPKWWMREQTRRMVAEEYLKLVYYLVRYQYSRGPLTDWLASLDQY